MLVIMVEQWSVAICKISADYCPTLCFQQILRKCGGSIELVDVSSELPQLVRRPGLKKWKVSCYGFRFYLGTFYRLFGVSVISEI